MLFLVILLRVVPGVRRVIAARSIFRPFVLAAVKASQSSAWGLVLSQRANVLGLPRQWNSRASLLVHVACANGAGLAASPSNAVRGSRGAGERQVLL